MPLSNIKGYWYQTSGTKLKTQNEQNMTQKSNAFKLASAFDKIKPCRFTHGSCSYNHTPLRGEQQATIYYDWLRCEEATMGKRKRRIFKRRGMEKLSQKTVSVGKNVKTRRGGKENNV